MEKKSVEEWLRGVDYGNTEKYIPSDFSLEFVNFIKLVNGSIPEENVTPVLHYKMLDNIAGKKQNIANMVHRGGAKSTLLEYLFLYLAVYGSIPGFGDVQYALYVSDSMDNGVDKMRKGLQRRYDNSDFMKTFVPEAKFVEARWYFKNIDGNEFVVTGHGAKTGVRGTRELGTRPQLACLDDLLSDKDASSDTIIKDIEDTVYKAIDFALHPTKRKIIWNGTPFNSRDPLYKAIESGAWSVSVYPVCVEFPCDKKDFVGSWEDRFPYEYVKGQYDKALATGKIAAFNQELMLRIMSDEDRVVLDSDMVWYKRDNILKNKGLFNFYITTDFATSDKNSGDYSVISVWAYNNNGDWMWVDGICKRQLMDKNIDDLFRLCQMYSPQSVGIEVTGQQGGFIPWITNEMVNRNIYFPLASDNNSNKPGIRPNTDKYRRFTVIEPLFKLRKIWFPEELREEFIMKEAYTELSLITFDGFKSLHDDFIDTVSMLGLMKPFKPSVQTPNNADDSANDFWDDINERSSHTRISRYIV